MKPSEFLEAFFILILNPSPKEKDFKRSLLENTLARAKKNELISVDFCVFCEKIFFSSRNFLNL